MADGDGVKTFLLSLGMGHHFDMFLTRGYDDESDIPHLNESDLRSIGVSDPLEIATILKAAQTHKHSTEYILLRWLRDHGLSHYFEGFVQSGLIHLSEIAQRKLPDELLYDELEITLPGHQRRLQHAVSALHKRLQRDSVGTKHIDVVAEGWWGFPTYLPNAKYPFLCLQASIKSTLEPATSKSIDFMVDSGSDVSTLREDIIQGLNLEPITTVRSCGAYGSQRTTMYKAFIIIGVCKLEIEIIGSSYDSLGSRVLRHFHHQIDNSGHKWLRVTRKSSPYTNNHGNLLPLNSLENKEQETVSLFPKQIQSINQKDNNENSGSHENSSLNTGNGEERRNKMEDPGSQHCEPFDLATQGDETDTGWRLSQCTISQSRAREIRKRNREDSPANSMRLSNAHNVDSLQNPSLQWSAGSHTAASHDCSPSRVNCLLTDKISAMPSQKLCPRTELPQEGHLKLSGNGTLSLSFGNEGGGKRLKTSKDET